MTNKRNQTPLTDAAQAKQIYSGGYAEMAQHARILERQRAALMAALEHISTGGDSWTDCVRVARAALAKASR